MYVYVSRGLCSIRFHVTGVTAASSETHTRWCRKQASSLALSSAPVAAGRASSLPPWRTLNGMCRYRRGGAEIPAGVSVTVYVQGIASGRWRCTCKIDEGTMFLMMRLWVTHVNPPKRGYSVE